ncbi:MAG TPA: histidine kinase [Solirubrobacteraceae bacterium]|nr:histidine kinase [Solirubrobacteraceae bacterium]
MTRTPWVRIGAAACAAGALVAVVAVPGIRATTTASAATAVDEGVARGVMAAIPIAVGLYASHHRAHARFGRLLLGFSVVWLLALLSSSSSSLIYSVGRLSGWISVLLLACVILAYPTGRLVSRADRAVALAVVAAVLVLYIPTALLVARYPVPTPFANCTSRCPDNAFMLIGHEPGWVGGFLSPFRDLVGVVVLIVVAIRLAQRIRGANTLVRHTLVPLFLTSIAWLTALALALVLRRAAPRSPATITAAWLTAVAMPAVTIAFMVGIARWHLFVSAAVRKANSKLQKLPTPIEVRAVLAEVFEDPALEIGRWARRHRRWVASDGRTLIAPAANSGRWLTEVRDGDRHVAAIEHDMILRDEPAFTGVAGSLAAIAFERERLATRTTQMLLEVRASRTRLLAAADSERRRIARDLHDGAQQRLLALRIELELAAEEAEHDNPNEASTLRGFSAEIEQALEEFRSMTREIYPAILSDLGIADALRATALRSAVPTTVEVGTLAEYPLQVATAVYFCCVEALQNVAKHAPVPTNARIVIGERDSMLRFSVTDDGPGFRNDRTRLGAGMINMRDRMAAVGGELRIRSAPGQGTSISGKIPLTPGTAERPAPHARAGHRARARPGTSASP